EGLSQRRAIRLHRLLPEEGVRRIAGDEVEEERDEHERAGRGEQGAHELLHDPAHGFHLASTRLRRLPCGSTRTPSTARWITPVDSSWSRGRVGRSRATIRWASW